MSSRSLRFIRRQQDNLKQLEEIDAKVIEISDMLPADLEEEVIPSKNTECTEAAPATSHLETETETTEEAAPVNENPQATYASYINSAAFKTDLPHIVIEKCKSLSCEDNEDIKAFWHEYYDLLKEWLHQQKIATVRSILDVIPEGITTSRWCMRGVFVGIDIAQNDNHQKLLSDLIKTVEFTGNVEHHLQKEQTNQRQILEFVQQLNNASEVISKFQLSVEQIRLECFRQVVPSSVPGPFTAQPDKEDFEVFTDLGTPIEGIEHPGVYTSIFGVVKLGYNGISSIHAKGQCLESLKCLIGKCFSLCRIILNADLIIMQQKAVENINWIGFIFEGPKESWKALFVQILSEIPKKTYQWARKDTD